MKYNILIFYMWRLFLVLFIAVFGFLILRKKMKKPSFDKTDELVTYADIEDLENHSILDHLCKKAI
ncbi:hypothetical protein NY2A_b210R [Paramecium bursaria Chlorella virus NY2A]|uniref:Uncharacterized protein b210R n=1 Tax=Paramecium bursaria Chlorella virus NY2A TaxID=46021 RepID=A7IW85_PBCVN|nr:hypothetical protein NY2A_b210R [Paramecium bursaria Chlorella virus NY2A]YP_001498278.1 hypothetical protein AR158_c196R [Paramecium bursaria Chlorella virus AR158]ABT14609.1 hypothetical protein NY2A_b210R [Paramecium bursaria Chlorella virus NY2A]ABU43742.1 hypothetical protein AR158_c196R [Paramecium bursaria Chlorella virus AR158]